MLLAVAVLLLQFQPAFTVWTPADSASTLDRSASLDRTRAKTADSTADILFSLGRSGESERRIAFLVWRSFREDGFDSSGR
jgi:hypothetical protein